MATDTTAVIVPGEGHFYIAPIATSKPTGVAVPTGAWVEVGHTSYDSPLTIEREGGESKVLPSWQATAVRTAVSPLTYKLGFALLQHDERCLTLYYGGGAINATTDEFEVPKNAEPQISSLFVRVVDGSAVWAEYFPTVEIIGSDSIEYDPEDMLGMPVQATVIDDADVSYLFTIKGTTTVE